MPLGQSKSNFNFNLDEKRVLNFENEVSDADNIKQDMSIDVYGRQEEEAAESKPLPPPKQQTEVKFWETKLLKEASLTLERYSWRLAATSPASDM